MTAVLLRFAGLDEFGHDPEGDPAHHPSLWALLPDREDPVPTVPGWPQFMRGCIRYRQSLDEQLPSAPGTREEAS